MQGYGVPTDRAKAEYWLSVAAVQPAEQRLLASIYKDGDYLPQNAKKADYGYRKAGRSSDLFELAEMYRHARPSQVKQAASIYIGLLGNADQPEFRRSQIELGNFVLDGTFSAGDDIEKRALNLQWAKSIAQELLGQSEYNIALDFEFGRESVPREHAMWIRYCERAAAYNIDLAQEFLGKAMFEQQIPGATSAEGYAWIELAADKRHDDRKLVQSLAERMNPEAKLASNAFFLALTETRQQSGAYYRSQDPLKAADVELLAKMPSNDPDVELRRAFVMEQAHTPDSYTAALALYRDIRDNSHRAAMAALGLHYLRGDDSMPLNMALAHLWLQRAADEGYKPAALLLVQ